MLNRFSSLSLEGGVTLKNRVVVPPMASQTADKKGFATEATLDHYERLSKSGTAIVFVEYTYVHSSGRSEPNQLSVESDAHIDGLSQISNIIHKAGAVAGLQLTHSGGKTDKSLTGGVLMGPSDVSVPVRGKELEPTTPMSLDEISNLQSQFFEAVKRSCSAIFEIVEFHLAHGYGLNQWISPITNQRQDPYGKNLEGRLRLFGELLQMARKACPKLLFSARIPGQDLLPGGLSISDMQLVAKQLEGMGLDIIDVSSGLGGWKRPRDRSGEGYLVSESEAIQKVVSIPVIGVGGITTGQYIDEALQKNKLSLAAVGRAILADPQKWKQKNLMSKSGSCN
jgi:NADPH2 dehydrogenase